MSTIENRPEQIFLVAANEGPRSDAAMERFRLLAEEDVVGRHQLVENADQATLILFVDLHTLATPSPSALRRHPLARTFSRRVRVYDERDQAFLTFPGLYVSPSPRLVRRGRQAASPYISTISNTRPADQQPDLLFSFQGASTHPLRDRAHRLSHERAVVENTTAVSFFHPDQVRFGKAREDARRRYADTIARSKFVLCPRGFGPSSFRLYEALGAGRVPVIISDEWVPPAEIPWHSCSVRVPERDIEKVPQILERLEGSWPEYAAQAKSVHARYFGEHTMWDYLINQLASVAPASAASFRPWWVDRQIIRAEARRLGSTAAGA